MKLCPALAAILIFASSAPVTSQEKFDKLKKAVVLIRALDEKGDVVDKGSGNGAIIEIEEKRIFILTAWHIVQSRSVKRIEIVIANGTVLNATIFNYDEENDFAVLESPVDRTTRSNLACLTINKKSKYKPTTPIIVAISQNPAAASFYRGSLKSSPEKSFILYTLERGYHLRDGESGSPLLDKKLRIIGLNHGHKTEFGELDNVAIRSDFIGKILNEWGIQYTEPPKFRPLLVGSAVALASGWFSLKFHASAKKDYEAYKDAITIDKIQDLWKSAGSKRKRGNIAAFVSYATAAFTGYQLWRNHAIPIVNKSPCQAELYPIFENHYADHSRQAYGIGLRLNF